MIDLKNETSLYGLAERVIASESAIYIASQLDRLKTYMQCHIPESNWDSIAQLIDQVRFAIHLFLHIFIKPV